MSPTSDTILTTKPLDFIGSSIWSIYDKQAEEMINEWQPISAKLIFLCTDDNHITQVVVSQKRSSKKQKNFHLEFPGGKIDPHESVMDGLKREIQEEDPSKVLLKSFNQELKRSVSNVYYLKLRLPNKQHHIFFKTTINIKNWKKLTKFYKQHKLKNKETFGFYLIEKKYLKTPFYKKQQWTPKSHQLLKAMKKLSSKHS